MSSKSGYTYDAASISSSSLMSEKERAQTHYGAIEIGQSKRKPSTVSRLVEKIKSIEPPEPRIPERKHANMPAWGR